MTTIYKYALEEAIDMPNGAQILHAGLDPFGVAHIWAIVDTDQPLTTRFFKIVGTGHEFDPTGLAYIGTIHNDPFIWHVFEATP